MEQQPTIEELEKLLDEDDLSIAILPNGEVRAVKRPTIHDLPDILKQVGDVRMDASY